MKPSDNFVIKESRHVGQSPKEFLPAFGISLFMHIFLCVAVNLFVGSFRASPHFKMQPVSFEVSLSQANESKNTSKLKSRTKRRSPLVASSASGAPDRQKELPSREHAEAISTSNLEQEQTGGAEPRRYAAATPSADLEPPRSMPNTANLTPKLLPYKSALSSPQRQAILKKVKEIVSKPLLPKFLDSSFAWERKGQRFQFKFSHWPAQSATGLDELLVSVTTVEGGDTISTQMRMRRMAFSQFAQFVDYWDPHVAIHDDEFDGRFHSNSALVISGSGGAQPKFHGKVTTAAYSLPGPAPAVDDREVFLEGIEEGADHIPLPRVFLGIPRDTSRSQGHLNLFKEESWITFHNEGAYSWRTASAPAVEHHAVLSSDPNSLIGKAKLHVKGVVKGQVLVYSEKDIIIDDDVFYAQNPEAYSLSKDFLGLVSNKDIEIAPPSITGPGDLKIYAAMLAKGRFRVPHLYTRTPGTLHVYGSLSAGSITATEPRYATRIRFDKRFEKMRPPNFPMLDRYEIAEWDERWTVE